MIKKRIILVLTFLDGVLFRTKNFIPDYRYTKNFIDLWSADEIVLIDISKKKFDKKFLKIVNYFANNCFLPITVGGGINSLKKANYLFRNGADKIILNSVSYTNIKLIKQISKIYGQQSIIHSIDCKKISNKYFVTFNNGKINSGYDPIEWCSKIVKNGVGEILINNVDKDGSLTGFDIQLLSKFNKFKKPILALGGAGNWEHFFELFKKLNISGVCTQNIFHFTEKSLGSLKKYLNSKNIPIRK